MAWDDLRYVLALRRAGNLTGAARELAVARTTVGRRLREVEQRLGVRLFDRTPEGLVPTAAGAELAEAAEGIEGEVLTAEGRLLGRDAELQGGLRVSTLDFVFGGFAEVFASFLERYPRVDLTVCASTEQVSLARREADVALRLANEPGGDLVGRRLVRLQFEVYAARSLAERVGLETPLSEWPWLDADERSGNRWLETWRASHAPGARVAFRTPDYGVMRRALGQGMGVHFLPCFDGDADPTLVSLGHRLTEPVRHLWVLTLPDLRHNRRIRAFMDHCYEAFEPYRQAALVGE